MKRIAAIVLPRLACELARRRVALCSDEPLGVLVEAEAGHDEPTGSERAIATLAAVDDLAMRYGARPGQCVAEATAFVGRLRTIRIDLAEIRRSLGEVAEVALGMGTTAAIALGAGAGLKERGIGAVGAGGYPGGAGAGPEDTVWLDVSGCARLSGGEDLLSDELQEHVAALGHCVRVAIADGPRIAQAVARWAKQERVVPTGRGAQAMGGLPIAALPLGSDARAFLGKLGILRVADLGTIDHAQLASRLGESARDLLALLAGCDERPLIPYAPTPTISEQVSFEHEVAGTEPLLFVLGGLVSRAASRLLARGEAAGRVRIELEYDRSMARHAQLAESVLCLTIDLPLALGGAEELVRAVRAKIEASELAAPVVAVTLTLEQLGPRTAAQLDMSRRADADPRALPALLAELETTLGAGRVGVLCWVDSHCPEAQSALRAVQLDGLGRSVRSGEAPHDASMLLQRMSVQRLPGSEPLLGTLMPPSPEGGGACVVPWWWQSVPTRLLSQPHHLGPIAAGALVTIGRQLYTVDRIRFVMRIEQVKWWTPAPLSRDYVRLWLHTTLHTAAHGSVEQEHAEAWTYLEPGTGHGYLHGWFD